MKKITLSIANMLFIISGLYAQSWTTQTVDNNGNIGRESEMVFDSDGNPHVVYTKDEKAMYAHWTGDGWQTRELYADIYENDTYPGHVQMKITRDDRLIVLISDQENSGNKVLRCSTKRVFENNTEWVSFDFWLNPNMIDIENIDFYIDESTNNTVHVVAGDSQIIYCKLTFDNSTNNYTAELWETIDNSDTDGWGKAITMTSDGNLHAVWYESTSTNLKMATYNGTSWMDVNYVDESGNVGKYVSMVADGDDILHISYYDEENGDLKYMTVDKSPSE